MADKESLQAGCGANWDWYNDRPIMYINAPNELYTGYKACGCIRSSSMITINNKVCCKQCKNVLVLNNNRYNMNIIIENPQEKIKELVRLLIEARDALPAINLSSARLYGIDLPLADRIEAALEPWEIKE